MESGQHSQAQKTETTETQAQSFPFPIIVDPTQNHDLTIIFLHGRGFNASQFHLDLLDAKVPEYESLRLAFPNARFVFPNAPRMRAFKYRRAVIPQWYEGSGDWEMESLGNIKDSIEYVHGLVRDEIQKVEGKSSRIVLGGFSQGCAMALMSLLLWDGEALGGLLGLSGFMPFTSLLLAILEDEDAGSDGDEVFESANNKDDTSAMQRALTQLSSETDMPASQRPSSSCISTPVFMAHGEQDREVDIEQARKVCTLLQLMGVSVTFNKYPGLTHALSAAVLKDTLHFVKTRITI